MLLMGCALAAALAPWAKNPEQRVDIPAIIEEIRAAYVPDKRQGVYEVQTLQLANGRVVLDGRISDARVMAALDSALAAAGAPADNNIVLLPQDKWGQVKIAVAMMRTAPGYSSELATQAIMGMPVRLLENRDGWWRIQTPDGYLGWVWRGSIAEKSPAEMETWRAAPRLVVKSLTQVTAYDDPKTVSPRHVVSDMVPGAIVEGSMKDARNGRVQVTLPDGRKGWVDARALAPLDVWASQDFNPDVILDQAYSMEGASYLWGGTSAKTTDCSGLVKVSYLANGLILRRDASQQALIGGHLEPQDWRDYQPGDLMFFAERPGGRVTHVAIYDADGMFVHCAGRVHRSSIDPESPDYVDRIFLGGSRIHGYEGTEGITHVRDHPWYF